MTLRQRGFLFDPNRCLGCRTCIMACAANKNLPVGMYFRTIENQEQKIGNLILKYYLSTSCNHCNNPECFRLCPKKALKKRKDGIVLHDPLKCDGCGTCTRSCPFEAPVINNITGKMIKCDLCHEKIDEGKQPACIVACPVKALQLINIDEIDSQADDIVRRLPGVIKIQITRPAMRYKKLKIGSQALRNSVADNLEQGELKYKDDQV